MCVSLCVCVWVAIYLVTSVTHEYTGNAQSYARQATLQPQSRDYDTPCQTIRLQQTCKTCIHYTSTCTHVKNVLAFFAGRSAVVWRPGSLHALCYGNVWLASSCVRSLVLRLLWTLYCHMVRKKHTKCFLKSATHKRSRTHTPTLKTYLSCKCNYRCLNKRAKTSFIKEDCCMCGVGTIQLRTDIPQKDILFASYKNKVG